MIEFKDIAKANESIRTMTISRTNRKTGEVINKEYAEVNQRIKAFRMCYPGGAITTEIVSNENGIVTMQTTVRDDEGKVLATGYAYEKEGATQINSTSYIENCETSAVGRALGMCGFGIDTSVASYEEVKQAQAQQDSDNGSKEAKPSNKEEQPKANYRQDLIDYCGANDLDLNNIAKEYKLNAKSTENDFLNALTKLKGVK